MPHESREARADAHPLVLPWGMPTTDVREDLAGAAGLWLTGGAALLLWTALALLLTSA